PWRGVQGYPPGDQHGRSAAIDRAGYTRRDRSGRDYWNDMRYTMQIRGIIPPVATAMQANEDLDLPRFRWFLDRLIQGGVHGLFVLGTNSEFYALDEREKQEIVATAVEHVRGRVPVFAGTGAETTREVVRLTKMVEREKA